VNTPAPGFAQYRRVTLAELRRIELDKPNLDHEPEA
jgi:hypothetical protein